MNRKHLIQLAAAMGVMVLIYILSSPIVLYATGIPTRRGVVYKRDVEVYYQPVHRMRANIAGFDAVYEMYSRWCAVSLKRAGVNKFKASPKPVQPMPALRLRPIHPGTFAPKKLTLRNED